MTDYKIVRPIIHDTDGKRILVADDSHIVNEKNISKFIQGYSIISRMLQKLHPGEVEGGHYTSDYPHRNAITHNQATSSAANPSSARVDNLVTGPVEVLDGQWFLGVFKDTALPDAGEHPMYVFEIRKPSDNNGVIANDYFETAELRNGDVRHIYQGTVYRTSTANVITYRSMTTPYVGTGESIDTDNHKDPSPTDVVRREIWFVPRKLTPGEVPSKVITNPHSRYIEAASEFEAAKTDGFYVF